MRVVFLCTLAALAVPPVPAFSQTPERQAAPEALPGVETPIPLPSPPGSTVPVPGKPRTADESGSGKGADSERRAKADAAAQAEAALSPAERLDTLFSELKREPDATAAAKISARIEEEWATSGSATVDLLLQWAGEAMAKDNKAAALDLLGEAIVLKPDYAEGWNRRATLHFLEDDYGKSIYDIEQTLRLEPRHYGALMGLGAILEETDRKPQALDAYTRALAVYPALKSAQDAVGRLAEELAGQAI